VQQWILGYRIADIAGDIESEVVDFIERNLVYKLVWALEAVRVRAVAAGEVDELGFNGYTAMAVETGSHLYSASLLIHCGLASRLAAIKAVTDEAGTFADTREMRRWVFSQSVKRRTQNQNWPTQETASLWREFVDGLSRPTLEKWEEKEVNATVNWFGPPLRAGTPVRVINGGKIFTIKWQPVGELTQPVHDAGGIFLAHVGRLGNSIIGQYVGPRQ
jgi:hypothetical protein